YGERARTLEEHALAPELIEHEMACAQRIEVAAERRLERREQRRLGAERDQALVCGSHFVEAHQALPLLLALATARDEPTQSGIAGATLGEQHHLLHDLALQAGRERDLCADDQLESELLGSDVRLDRAVHAIAVGDGER